MFKHTEKTMQMALQAELNRRAHQNILPNVMVDWGEADLLSTTRKGYLHEYEIKISRKDFYADFNKNKHAYLGIKDRVPGGRRTASCFWFATPDGLVDISEVPDYAGFITVHGEAGVVIRRRAPMLHRRKLGPYQWQWLLRISALKLWAVKRDLREAIDYVRMEGHANKAA